MKTIFEEIYTNRHWGEKSGPGSEPESMVKYYEFIEQIVKKYNPSAIIDLGCGYFKPYSHLKLNNANYIGIDVVENCIKQNKRFQNNKREFICDNWLTMSNLPKADLVICKDVLQHWNHTDICEGLRLLNSYELVILTNTIFWGNAKVNENIITGGFRPLNVTEPPYSIKPIAQLLYNVITNPSDQKLSILWRPKKSFFNK